MYQEHFLIVLSNRFVTVGNQEIVHSYFQINQHYHVIHLIIQLTILPKRLFYLNDKNKIFQN